MIEFPIKFCLCYLKISRCFIKYYKTLHLIIINLTQFIELKIILLILHSTINGNQHFILVTQSFC